MIVGIYKITSPNNKIYIGQSWDINYRFYRYNLCSCKNQTKLYNSLKKYSPKSHIFEIICELPNDIYQNILDNYEMSYIQQYKNCGFEMLNLKEGGSGGGKHSKETKLKISNILIGKKPSEETREKLSKIRKGRKLSEETKLKIGFSHKNKKYTEEQKIRLHKTCLESNKYKEGRKKIGKSQLIPIICNETKEIFEGSVYAVIKTGIKRSSISSNLRGITKITKQGLSFSYYTDSSEQSNEAAKDVLKSDKPQ